MAKEAATLKIQKIDKYPGMLPFCINNPLAYIKQNLTSPGKHKPLAAAMYQKY